MSFDVVLKSILSAAFLASVIRVATPLLLPAIGGLISGAAGVINVALEGMMLTSAFVGVVVSAYTQNAWLGCLAGVAATIVLAIVLAYFHLNLKADIILAGLALNILASGGTIFLLYILTHDKGNSSKLASLALPRVTIPLLDSIPFLGPVLSGHNILTYVAFLLAFLTWVFLYKTSRPPLLPSGLRISPGNDGRAQQPPTEPAWHKEPRPEQSPHRESSARFGEEWPETQAGSTMNR